MRSSRCLAARTLELLPRRSGREHLADRRPRPGHGAEQAAGAAQGLPGDVLVRAGCDGVQKFSVLVANTTFLGRFNSAAFNILLGRFRKIFTRALDIFKTCRTGRVGHFAFGALGWSSKGVTQREELLRSGRRPPFSGTRATVRSAPRLPRAAWILGKLVRAALRFGLLRSLTRAACSG